MLVKIAKPKLYAQLEPSTVADMIDDGQLEDASLDGDEATNCNIAGLDMSGVTIDKVQFTGAHFSRLTMRDVIARQADFSSASLDSGSVVRVEFINCRMMGVDFSQASLHDVVFRGCKLDLANFRRADLRRVQFVDCTLIETDFGGATLTSVQFQSSLLDKTIFTQVACKSVDLRSSQLVDIYGWRSLKAATIDGSQLISAAPYLAQELGIIVRD